MDQGTPDTEQAATVDRERHRWRLRTRLWRQQHPTTFSLLIALLLGAVIEFALTPYLLHDTKYVRRLGDRIADSMIRLAEKVVGVSPAAVPFVFVDVDNATWRDWQAPLVLPREKLAHILTKLASSGPRAIILDVNLAWADPDPKGETTFVRFLTDYASTAPPLILLRSGIRVEESQSRYPSERSTPFDAIIARRLAENPAPLIRWATAYFDVDPDNVIRRWRLAETFCRNNAAKPGAAEPVILPSVYLLAALLAAHPQDPRGTAEHLELELQHAAASDCHAPPGPAVEISGMPHPIVADAAPPGNRIIYSFAWEQDRLALGPLARLGIERVPLVSVRPAGLLTSASPDTPVDGLKDRIVIVGGSYSDSGDLHRTPLGIMPGALLIANAAHALLVNGTPEEPRPLWRLLLSFSLVIANALLFHFWRTEIASFAALGLLLVLMIVTVPLFASGVALDWEVPSLGVLIHRYLAFVERTLRQIRVDGWRAVIRSHERSAPEMQG